jgi:hypothetical protein
MTNFAAQLNALVTQIADATECEFWECHLLPDGEHHESCLTAAEEPNTTP